MTPNEVPEALVQAALTAIRSDGADDWGSEYDRLRIGLAAALPLYDQRRLEKEFEAVLKVAPHGLSIVEHRWRVIDDFGPYTGEFTTEADAFGQLFRSPPSAYVQVRTITEGPWHRTAGPSTTHVFEGGQQVLPLCCCRGEALILLCVMCGTGRHWQCPDNPAPDGDGERHHEEGGDDG